MSVPSRLSCAVAAALLSAAVAGPCGWSSLAHADPVDVLRTGVVILRSEADYLEQQQASLREVAADVADAAMLAELYLRANVPRSFEGDLAVSGALGAQDARAAGDLAVSARLRVTGDLCDLAEVGAMARSSGGRGVSAQPSWDGAAEGQLWGSVCLPKGFSLAAADLAEASAQDAVTSSLRLTLFPLRLHGSVALNAAPSLAARRNASSRSFSQAGYGLAVEGVRVSRGASPRGVSLAFVAVEQRWEWEGLPGEGEAGYELDAEFGFFRFYRVRAPLALADRAIDLLVVRPHGVRYARSAGLLDAYPVRIAGLGLGSDRVLLDAAVGLAASGATIGSSDGGDILPDPRVADVTTAGGHLRVSVGTVRRATGVAATRALDTNLEGVLTLENRVTAWTKLETARLRVRGEAFGGMATHFLDRDTRGDERFVGAVVSVDRAWRDSLWLGLRGEGVTSFRRDPILDGAVGGDRLQLLATLSWTRALTSHPL